VGAGFLASNRRTGLPVSWIGQVRSAHYFASSQQVPPPLDQSSILVSIDGSAFTPLRSRHGDENALDAYAVELVASIQEDRVLTKALPPSKNPLDFRVRFMGFSPPTTSATGKLMVEMDTLRLLATEEARRTVFSGNIYVRIEPTGAIVQGSAGKLVPLPPSDKLAQLVAAICQGRAVETADCISLPEGLFWPDLKSTILYVRHFYVPLWEKVLNKGLPSESLQAAAIIGTPGIAKSAFGLYAFYRGVREGRTVIYNSRKSGRVIHKQGQAYDADLGFTVVNPTELNDETTLYISDSIPPVPSKGAFTLLVTSPKKENWSSFSQTEGSEVLTVPNFSNQEMMQLWKLAFADKPGCSKEEVQARLERWGGVPRNVLTKGRSKVWQDRTSNVIDTLTIDTLTKALQPSTTLDGVGKEDNCHRLLNIVPKGALSFSDTQLEGPRPDHLDYYRFNHAEVVTDYVMEAIANHLLTKRTTELYHFLHLASADPAVSNFRGRLYQQSIVIPKLTMGHLSSLEAKRLSPKTSLDKCSVFKAAKAVAEESFRLHRMDGQQEGQLPLVRFKDVDTLRSLWNRDTKDAIFLPPRRCFPVVDLILRLSGEAILVNATVGDSHDIKVASEAFVDLLEAVGLIGEGCESKEIPLVWALPQDAWGRFQEPGRLIGKSASEPLAGHTGTHPIGRRIGQYKLLIPVPKASSDTSC
jgi:hypothetical protein